MRRWIWPFFVALTAVWLGAGRGAFGADASVIELPPMMVEETATSVRWLYARVNGFEFLSRCSAATTRRYAEAWQKRLQLLQTLVPEPFLARTELPAVVVLYAQDGKQAVSPEIQRELQALQSGGGDYSLGSLDRTRMGFAPNMRLNDRDMHAVFVSVNEARFDASTLIVSPGYLHYLLERRVPVLPTWLIEGIDRTYLGADFVKAPITLPPLVWANRWESEALARNPDRPRALLPANELFASTSAKRGDTSSPRRLEVMLSGTELLVRWAIDSGGEQRDAFWRLANRAAEEPLTEEVFEACFGFGFSELRDRLSDYLPRAVKEPLRIAPGKLPALPRVEVRPATPNEIARLRGEWERLAISYVQNRLPQVRELYVEQARRTLRKAFESGDRDPRLLATMGLCEIDAGNPAGARDFLESAIAAGVVRPRVYFEIARLRFVDLRSNLPETKTFTYAELATVLAPLRKVVQQAPLLPEAFALFAEAWVRSTEPPTAADLAVLEQGARLFARQTKISFYLALAFTRHGRAAQAKALLAAGEDYLYDEATRQRFAQLNELLVRTPSR